MPENSSDMQTLDASTFKAEIARLNKIIQALMNRAERSSAAQGSDFNLFQTAIVLEEQVRRRTQDLEAAMRENEKINRALQQAKARMELEIQERMLAEEKVLHRNSELTQLNIQLSQAQEQLMQSEKLASLGQLAAGVAHEINNPIGFIFSNFGTLNNYLDDLFEILSSYEAAEKSITDAVVSNNLKTLRDRLEIDFLKNDISQLMTESKEGLIRVRKIVQDLKNFSRVDSNQEWQWADLHQGIDSTLNIINSEVKYKADIIKDYGDIPNVECLPSQINQVFMNLLVNAAHAIGETRGTITVRTSCDLQNVWIEIIDNGSGIPKANLSRIFDPFFTTKPVGKGTGLGLSLSYGIIKKHHGNIEVESEVDQGTTFRISLPIKHRNEDEPEAPKTISGDPVTATTQQITSANES
jgi:signal transduction histidine kinase